MTRVRQVLPRAEEYMQGLPLDQSAAAVPEAASSMMRPPGDKELQVKVEDAPSAAASPAATTCTQLPGPK